jgi:hypothetical protein
MIMRASLSAENPFEGTGAGYRRRVEFGTSIFLIAVGAVLRYAVTGSVEGVRIHTVGLILMLVGVLGLILSLLYMFFVVRPRERRLEADPYYDSRTRGYR